MNEKLNNLKPGFEIDPEEMAKLSGPTLTERLLRDQIEKLQQQELIAILLAILRQNSGEVKINPVYIATYLHRPQSSGGFYPKISMSKTPDGKFTLSMITQKEWDEMWKEVCHQHWFTDEPEGGYSVEYEHKESGETKVELWKSKKDYDEEKEPDEIIFRDYMRPMSYLHRDVREYFRGSENG